MCLGYKTDRLINYGTTSASTRLSYAGCKHASPHIPASWHAAATPIRGCSPVDKREKTDTEAAEKARKALGLLVCV